VLCRDQTTFTRDDVGVVEVTLTVTDACGNSDQCTAQVTVEEFDLALRKVLADGEDERVYPGEDVTFTIEVFNQGTIDASNVEVTDYIPDGFVLNDAAWTGGSSATTIIPFIAAGSSESVDITLTVTATAAGPLVNEAEISNADAEAGFEPTDVDSSPDSDQNNDAGGEVNGSTVKLRGWMIQLIMKKEMKMTRTQKM